MVLALAYHLSVQRHTVTVFESESQLGGLATYHDYGPFFWDRFYHVIVPSDAHLLRFLSEIGLADRVRWSRTLTGFYVDERMYSLSSTSDFLRFPLIGPIAKIRLALTILYCSRIRDWRRLEKVTVAEWLTKTCGHSTYEKFWKPLLLAKLGVQPIAVHGIVFWQTASSVIASRWAARFGHFPMSG